SVAIKYPSSIGGNIFAANGVLLGLDESWLSKVISLFGEARIVGIQPNKKLLRFVVLLQTIVDRREIVKRVERRIARPVHSSVRSGIFVEQHPRNLKPRRGAHIHLFRTASATMSLLTELKNQGNGPCYKDIAPNRGWDSPWAIRNQDLPNGTSGRYSSWFLKMYRSS